MERIYLDKTAFMLCRDIHPGTDTRYLVIFKDTSLKTIRDLTGDHVELLTEVQATISQFLKQRHPDTHSQFKTFFHYTPSVFQLHAETLTVWVVFHYTPSVFQLHTVGSSS